MKWHLTVDVNLKESFKRIKHQDKILLMGSCFSEHIGEKLEDSKFQVVQNPFGILYNPRSIEKALRRIANLQKYTSEDLKFENERYFSFDHHTSFSSAEESAILSKINSELEKAHQQLKAAHTLVFTFGTAFYYTLQTNSNVVGNCHKLPAHNFLLQRDSSVEIQKIYKEVILQIQKSNPNIQIVFTVSPVRHWKNGAADNNWSKAILIDAVRSLEEQISEVHYFPSYEIMMDELRDYRFYNEDLLHPNQQAVEVIWNRFKESCFEEEVASLLKQISQIKNAVNHKPFNFNSEQHQQFIRTTTNKIEILKDKFPYLNFEKEIQQLKNPK